MNSPTTAVPGRSKTDAAWLRIITASVAVCVVALVGFFVAGTFFDTVSEGDFTHTADYWYTGSGMPMAIAGIAIAFGVHRLQHGADGRLGRIGVWINAVALTELFIQLSASVIVGSELRWGPLYVVCSFLTFVGVALLSAGSWRTAVLPTWMLGIWPVLWILGTFAGGGPVPLLLAGFLVAMAVMLRAPRATS